MRLSGCVKYIMPTPDPDDDEDDDDFQEQDAL